MIITATFSLALAFSAPIRLDSSAVDWREMGLVRELKLCRSAQAKTQPTTAVPLREEDNVDWREMGMVTHLALKMPAKKKKVLYGLDATGTLRAEQHEQKKEVPKNMLLPDLGPAMAQLCLPPATPRRKSALRAERGGALHAIRRQP